MTQRQPNRATRRRIAQERNRQQKKEQKLLGKNNPRIFISCPKCKSRDVRFNGKKAGEDCFMCNKCGFECGLSEMNVEL